MAFPQLLIKMPLTVPRRFAVVAVTKANIKERVDAGRTHVAVPLAFQPLVPCAAGGVLPIAGATQCEQRKQVCVLGLGEVEDAPPDLDEQCFHSGHASTGNSGSTSAKPVGIGAVPARTLTMSA